MTLPGRYLDRDHHAGEAMRCAIDAQPWPCRAFLDAFGRWARGDPPARLGLYAPHERRRGTALQDRRPWRRQAVPS